jgi:uncharacterized protein YukE
VDLNPIHWIGEINEQIGHSTADVLEFVGITNPAVDPEGIREVARHWKALGDALDDAHWHVGQALGEIRWEGKSADAFHARTSDVRDHCQKAAGVLHRGHDQLNKFADQAHELISQIGVLCAQILEFELAALPLSLLTGPLSEVAANLAAGERAAKIVALIARIAEAAKTVDRAVEAILEALGALGRVLKALAPIAEMATGGIALTVGFDALTDPDRLRHTGTLEEDVEIGALLGVLGGGFGKGVQGLVGRLGPRMMPAVAGAGGFLGDLGGEEDGLSRLGALMSRLSERWDSLPRDVKDRILENFERGNDFNERRKESYEYSEVRVEPPGGSDQAWAQVDGYNPGESIVSRKDTQLSEVAPSTWKGYVNEFVKKYSPGTKIISRKGDGVLYGTTLEGEMILEVPVQEGGVPAEIIRYADRYDITIRDEEGHVYTVEP